MSIQNHTIEAFSIVTMAVFHPLPFATIGLHLQRSDLERTRAASIHFDGLFSSSTSSRSLYQTGSINR